MINKKVTEIFEMLRNFFLYANILNGDYSFGMS